MTSIPWIAAIPIAMVANLDYLAVGIAFGIRQTRITSPSNLIIVWCI